MYALSGVNKFVNFHLDNLAVRFLVNHFHNFGAFFPKLQVTSWLSLQRPLLNEATDPFLVLFFFGLLEIVLLYKKEVF